MSMYRNLQRRHFRAPGPAPKPIPANAELITTVYGEAYRCRLCGNSPFSLPGIKSHLTPTGEGNKNCQSRRANLKI